mmetsp:Transcript_18771/g.31537  ORF Transcript_18771/g.31537 Transcript_18771/m.31537 type:complete len:104 (+) Transcript_18771:194-505(+)
MVTLSQPILSQLVELERLRREQDSVIRKINKLHLKLIETQQEDPNRVEKLPEKLWAKLRSFYEEASKLAETEERLAAQCIRSLDSRATEGQRSGTGPKANLRA